MSPAALFVTLILSFVPAQSTPQACSLDGLWLGTDRKDAVGMWLEFASDGSVVRAQGRIVDGEYVLKGDALILTSRVRVPTSNGGNVPGDMTQRVTVKVTGAEMARKADQATVEVARDESSDRRGRTRTTNPDVTATPVPAITDLTETKLTKVMEGDGGDQLSGVWAWKNRTGRAVLERFAGKRRFAVLEPMGGQRGTFKLEDNKLSVTADGSTTAVNVTCAGPVLALETPAGPMRFVKFQ